MPAPQLQDRSTPTAPFTSKLRALALAVVMLSTAWLLLADSAEECGQPAERAHVKLGGTCATQLFVQRETLACYATGTPESGALQFDEATGYVDLHDAALAASSMDFRFKALRRTDGVRLEDGSCALDGETHTYVCSGRTSTATGAASSSVSEGDLSCSGSYEVIQ